MANEMTVSNKALSDSGSITNNRLRRFLLPADPFGSIQQSTHQTGIHTRIITSGYVSLDHSGEDLGPGRLASSAAGRVRACFRILAACQGFRISAGEPHRHFHLVEAVA